MSIPIGERRAVPSFAQAAISATPPKPNARVVPVSLDPHWAAVANEIARVTEDAVNRLAGTPVTARDVHGSALPLAALIAFVETAIRSSERIRESWRRHHAPLSFVVPVAAGINALIEPFKGV